MRFAVGCIAALSLWSTLGMSLEGCRTAYSSTEPHVQQPFCQVIEYDGHLVEMCCMAVVDGVGERCWVVG